MRGSPLIRALLAFICILALGYPLWKLTAETASQSVPSPEPAPVSQKQSIHLQLSFTTVPSSVKVLHLGEEILDVKMPPQELEREFTLEYPKEGVDLQFDVEWPGDALAAIKVVLTDSPRCPA